MVDRGFDITEDAARDASKRLGIQGRAGQRRNRCEPDEHDGDGLPKRARNGFHGWLRLGRILRRCGVGTLLGREIEAGVLTEHGLFELAQRAARLDA